MKTKIEIFNFKYKLPKTNESIAFVCPIQKDRWEVGWMDWHDIRIEGGESFKAEELTVWFSLPKII